MLLKQGDFQKRPSAPSPSVTASSHSSPSSRGCQLGPFPSWSCPGLQRDPEGKIRGDRAPSGPAGMERRWFGGSATPRASPDRAKGIPCPFLQRRLRMGQEKGEEKPP